MTPQFTESELEFITEAAQYLENPSLLMRLANLVGKPIEWLSRKYSPDVVSDVVETALERAMDLAIFTIPADEEKAGQATAGPAIDIHDIGAKSSFWHKLLVIATGGGGGALGLPGLAVELPVTTAAMFRSIAAIAKAFGEDLEDPAVRLQCLTVFSFGGATREDDAMESTYFATRMSLQEVFATAATVVAKASAAELAQMLRNGTAPALVRLLGKIAARFNVVVAQKFIAQSIPVLGAITGATVNVAFLDHFNHVAQYHFGIRRLERLYGSEVVQTRYREALHALREADMPRIAAKS
jgi:hypothetical protein